MIPILTTSVWEEQAWSMRSIRNIPGLATVQVEHNEIRRERREPTEAWTQLQILE